MTFTTVLTVGGIGITVALLETVLESMNKPSYAMIIRIIAVGAFSFFALQMFDLLLKDMEAFINIWNR